jgi:alkylation response protein AidB-like acyl-CoA dehydrogenase
MDFALTSEEKALTEALSQHLARVCSTARIRAWEADQVSFDDAFWAAVSEGGFLEAGLPWGDAPSLGMLIQLEEVAGRFLAPPVLSWHSAYAAPLLGERFAGELVAPVPPGRAQLTLDGGRLRGEAGSVLFLDRAKRVLALAHGSAALVDTAAVSATLVQTQSLVPQWSVTFEDAPAEVLPAPGCEQALARLRTSLAAWATGAGAQAIELASAYARERVQFDHPIGSYQSVQNRLVDAAIQVEQARMLVYRAAALIDAQDPQAEAMSRLARHHAGKAFVQASRAGLLTFGGYGFTVDFDIQLYFRRAKEAQLGFEPRVPWALAPAFRS